jgi:hypothetical protein
MGAARQTATAKAAAESIGALGDDPDASCDRGRGRRGGQLLSVLELSVHRFSPPATSRL